MYNVYRDRGKRVGVFNPYEPKLTNPIFLHPGNEGTPVGVWLSLDRKWEEDGVPDMVTILKVDNEFHTGYFSDAVLNFVIRSGRMPRSEVAERFPELSPK